MPDVFDPLGVIDLASENRTEWVLRNLHKSVQFRTDTNDNQQDEYREVLRCVITRDHENIANIYTINHEGLSSGLVITANPKGTIANINIQSGTKFSDWHMTDQRFDEIQQDGGKLFRETREYIAISNSETGGSGTFWEDFTWNF